MTIADQYELQYELDRLTAELAEAKGDVASWMGRCQDAETIVAEYGAALEAIIISDDPVTIAIKALANQKP